MINPFLMQSYLTYFSPLNEPQENSQQKTSKIKIKEQKTPKIMKPWLQIHADLITNGLANTVLATTTMDDIGRMINEDLSQRSQNNLINSEIFKKEDHLRWIDMGLVLFELVTHQKISMCEKVVTEIKFLLNNPEIIQNSQLDIELLHFICHFAQVSSTSFDKKIPDEINELLDLLKTIGKRCQTEISAKLILYYLQYIPSPDLAILTLNSFLTCPDGSPIFKALIDSLRKKVAENQISIDSLIALFIPQCIAKCSKSKHTENLSIIVNFFGELIFYRQSQNNYSQNSEKSNQTNSNQLNQPKRNKLDLLSNPDFIATFGCHEVYAMLASKQPKEAIEKEIQYWMTEGNIKYVKTFDRALTCSFAHEISINVTKEPSIFNVGPSAPYPPHLFSEANISLLIPSIKPLLSILNEFIQISSNININGNLDVIFTQSKTIKIENIQNNKNDQKSKDDHNDQRRGLSNLQKEKVRGALFALGHFLSQKDTIQITEIVQKMIETGKVSNDLLIKGTVLDALTIGSKGKQNNLEFIEALKLEGWSMERFWNRFTIICPNSYYPELVQPIINYPEIPEPKASPNDKKEDLANFIEILKMSCNPLIQSQKRFAKKKTFEAIHKFTPEMSLYGHLMLGNYDYSSESRKFFISSLVKNGFLMGNPDV